MADPTKLAAALRTGSGRMRGVVCYLSTLDDHEGFICGRGEIFHISFPPH